MVNIDKHKKTIEFWGDIPFSDKPKWVFSNHQSVDGGVWIPTNRLQMRAMFLRKFGHQNRHGSLSNHGYTSSFGFPAWEIFLFQLLPSLFFYSPPHVAFASGYFQGCCPGTSDAHAKLAWDPGATGSKLLGCVFFPMKRMWVQQCHVYHAPVITIFIGGIYKPFPSGWFMTSFYPH